MWGSCKVRRSCIFAHKLLLIEYELQVALQAAARHTMWVGKRLSASTVAKLYNFCAHNLLHLTTLHRWAHPFLRIKRSLSAAGTTPSQGKNFPGLCASQCKILRPPADVRKDIVMHDRFAFWAYHLLSHPWIYYDLDHRSDIMVAR
jgi:hypothetical protein